MFSGGLHKKRTIYTIERNDKDINHLLIFWDPRFKKIIINIKSQRHNGTYRISRRILNKYLSW